MFSYSKEQEDIMKNFKDFLLEENGMGVVEVILIIVILIRLLFWINDSWRQMNRRNP